jgi:hypothetical protein
MKMSISSVSTATQGVSQTQQSQQTQQVKSQCDSDKSCTGEVDKSATQPTPPSTATVGSNINTTA